MNWMRFGSALPEFEALLRHAGDKAYL